MAEKKSYSMSGAVIRVCILACMGVSLQHPAWAALDCNTVTQQITSCATYLTEGTPVPQEDSSCCQGVRSLYGDATTTDERQQICTCLKNEANNYNLNDTALQSLPSNCGLQLSFTITRNIDCSS